MEDYYFIAFGNTTGAMTAEDYLKKNNFYTTMIPTPREVTQSCGLSIKINPDNLDAIKELIEKSAIKIKGIYCIKNIDGSRKVETIL